MRVACLVLAAVAALPQTVLAAGRVSVTGAAPDSPPSGIWLDYSARNSPAIEAAIAAFVAGHRAALAEREIADPTGGGSLSEASRVDTFAATAGLTPHRSVFDGVIDRNQARPAPAQAEVARHTAGAQSVADAVTNRLATGG